MFNNNKTIFANVILIDIDDTLADTRAGIKELYTIATGDRNFKEAVRYDDMCPLWTEKEVNTLFHNSELLYSKIKPMPGATETVKSLLSLGYDIRVVTLQDPAGVYAKQGWLEKWFPELAKKVYYYTDITGNKSLFLGRALIDDNIKNYDTTSCEKPILLDIYKVYPSRKNDCGYCTAWNEVLDKIK